jgi:hypothetical protein
MTPAKPAIPKSVSKYMSNLARRANEKMRGTEMARERSRKAVEARRRKATERQGVNPKET